MNAELRIKKTAQSKLICMGCLKETPIHGVIDGKKYRKHCPACREYKNHVARHADFKVAGIERPRPKGKQDQPVQGLEFPEDSTTFAPPT